MAAVAGAAAALAPAVAGGAHKGAASVRRWSAAAAQPAARRALPVCQQQPERLGGSVATRAAAAEVRGRSASLPGQASAQQPRSWRQARVVAPCLILGPYAQLHPCIAAPPMLIVQIVSAVPLPTPALERFAAELQSAGGQQERSRLLLSYARQLPAYPEAARTDAHRVMGCTAQVGAQPKLQRPHAAAWAAAGGGNCDARPPSPCTARGAPARSCCLQVRLVPCHAACLQVWVSAQLDASGKVQFAADSDSELTRGLAALLVEGLSGLTPDEVLQVSVVPSAGGFPLQSRWWRAW